ncbi:carboxylesterase/lipase family protein [Streptomyces sp. HPF1205]|uniref:carboxylesterase/lipase family protein n=1 Tax=Streptomyces sp. HPF1205 TaxID=2873262 RepID=UPI001CECF2AA|nr:carboxylesterase family protein [Streptomyces sp. HPF1205]
MRHRRALVDADPAERPHRRLGRKSREGQEGRKSRRGRKGWSRLRAAAAAGALVTAVLGAAPAPAAAAHAPVVTVEQGGLRGIEQHGVERFLGVPYAAPPVGRLRWKPPQPAPRWSGTRSATAAGAECPQPGAGGTAVGSEDCLYLNVYAPARPAPSPRPVMVWIHGGSDIYGAGSLYDGSALAARGFVVVTINYRLGALGFLGLPSLAAESPDHVSGQYGLMDQQAALRWVHRNAAAFGGDARDVTLFGESAGGAGVCANLTSPTAAGLFQRAIAQSVCIDPTPSQRAAQEQGTRIAHDIGCGTAKNAAACLRRMPVAAVVHYQGEEWHAAQGAPLLPLPIDDALREGRYNHMPVLAGATHDEGTTFIIQGYQDNPLRPQEYLPALVHHFGPNAAKAVMRHYPLSAYGGDPDRALSTAVGDGMFSCAVHRANTYLQRTQSQPVYAYEFNDRRPLPYAPGQGGLGAFHGSEVMYVFQSYVDPFGRTRRPPFTPAQQALSDTMARYWTQFARAGDPNGPRDPYWPPFTERSQAVQSLSPRAVHPEHHFAAEHQCGFWIEMFERHLIDGHLTLLR